MEYLYFQTVIQCRLPIEGDKIGQPEIIKKFTTPMFVKAKIKKETKELVTEEQEEVLI